MAELDDLDSRARLAVLEVMGWPDDRSHPGTEDGVPPAAHWTLAAELVAKLAPLVLETVADEHDLITSVPGIWPTATAWMRQRAACWPDLEPPADHTTTEEPGS